MQGGTAYVLDICFKSTESQGRCEGPPEMGQLSDVSRPQLWEQDRVTRSDIPDLRAPTSALSPQSQDARD